MNIAVNGIDDVQDANDTDKDDKHPARVLRRWQTFFQNCSEENNLLFL